ncbi:MAG: hypothetical protein K6F95_12135 [Selenomonas sp.]|uniref:hypothetical protein n=1 Tax=Selenomonas sp. TaxID=2053611 RepID=UPI0025CD6C27|nr:hypothetical protein [Selenomonas sp.]MCR5758632.1 hypothetical protein [Selenomonas sp.]
MKKIFLLVTALMMLGMTTVLAAPVNQMAKHETAIGVGTKEAYIEHKVTNKATVGYAYNNRDEYGDQKDAYLQYDVIGSEVKLVGGYRWDMAGDKNNAYGGVAVSTPKIMGFDAYASYVVGKDFNETQVGINKNLLFNVDLNVNYHNFKPDNGHHEDGIGAGITVKF